ncbi:protein NUCLEAR FUSION DEFECTIVE 4-like isoform X2 [Ziziphus jujuba]|uniref:Protein NUCLEAR FUSION DEFECTIVE 4-like isoform X2 n=1 Tax=Ziziphus jujuba TaxID=326968 RepID=A0A6P3ZS97_ZIZJJ|nr:protein NUCLEAR FUSION DEFECTIVE 4-like isoform X2 [Ziziphus jujuba]
MEMLSNKWITTVVSIWIQCSVGAYTFSIYSPVLKSTQGYDQSTLDTVSVFMDFGGNLGVLSGFLYTAVTSRRHLSSGTSRFCGPWVVLLVGAIQCFTGYLFIWAAVSGLISRPPVPAMCFFMFLAPHGATFFNTVCVVCGVQNFSHHGGTIVGIMKSFNGLSGALAVQAFDILCKDNPTNFILMLALLPNIVSLSVMFLVRIDESSSTVDDKKHLNAFSSISLTIVGYRMMTVILENFITFPSWAQISSFILLLLLLISPLGIAINALIEDSKRNKISSEENPLEYEQLPSTSEDKMLLQNEEDMNLVQAMGSFDFWLLFVAMVCGMGTGVATINNMSQMGQSLGYKTKEINSLVALLSIWNFLGRLGGGYLSDLLLHERRWGRPLLMAITQATMGIGHIIIASGFSGNLYFGSFLVGICFGSQWSLMPIITSEIFGVLHMATIFNTITVASPIGSYIFSVRIIGYIYDKEAIGEENNHCFGIHCFRLSFLIMAFVAFLGCAVALILFFRTKRFYHLVVLRRLDYSLR